MNEQEFRDLLDTAHRLAGRAQCSVCCEYVAADLLDAEDRCEACQGLTQCMLCLHTFSREEMSEADPAFCKGCDP